MKRLKKKVKRRQILVAFDRPWLQRFRKPRSYPWKRTVQLRYAFEDTAFKPGLKCSHYKRSCRVAALNFFLNSVPQWLSDIKLIQIRAFFSFFFPGLTPVSLLVSKLMGFVIFTQFADTGKWPSSSCLQSLIIRVRPCGEVGDAWPAGGSFRVCLEEAQPGFTRLLCHYWQKVHLVCFINQCTACALQYEVLSFAERVTILTTISDWREKQRFICFNALII